MRPSNCVIGLLNFLTFVFSFLVLGGGIWLSHKGTTDCEKFLDKPMIVIGVFLLLVSLAGLIGTCCKVNWLLWVYLLVMFVLIVVLFCFTIFAFVVTNRGAGDTLSGKGYKEYRLGDYSNWLQKRVSSGKNWDRIRSCLVDAKVCQKLLNQNTTSESEFYTLKLSPVESGCCKPSNDCGYTYKSPTSWDASGNTTFTNADCNLWSNDPSRLCYDCQACKAGFLQTLKTNWKRVAIINLVALIVLIIVYSMGCCAFRNNREDNYYSQWKPYR